MGYMDWYESEPKKLVELFCIPKNPLILDKKR